MNIQPFKNDGVPVPAKPATRSTKPPKEEASVESATVANPQEKLRAALNAEPEVRTEEVERAKALAADPDYPSNDLLAKLAELFVNDARREK